MRTYALLIIGVASISFAAIFIRLADAPAVVIAFLRMAVASLVILPFTFNTSLKKFGEIRKKDKLLILVSGLFIALHFWLWITSLEYTSIASSVILVTSHPVFVVVMSYFLWRERINKQMLLGIAVAFLGVIVINIGGVSFGQDALLGNMLALGAAFAMGGYLLVGRQLRERVDAKSYLALVYTVSALFLAVITLFYGETLLGYSGQTYLMIVLLALIPQLIGHSSLNLAVRVIPVTIVSVAILGEPVGATLLGIAILGETPLLREIIGGIIILAGIFLVIKYSPKEINGVTMKGNKNNT